jgi:galactokinase/mevalonate kinase-like predicted kinase
MRYGVNMIVRTSAPNHILDIGSWTDTAFAEHGAVLNGAIDAFTHVSLRPRSRRGVAVRHDADGGVLAYRDFLQVVAGYFEVDGFEATIRQDNPAGLGLGASAATAVALTAAVARYAGRNYHNLQIAIIAHRIRSEECERPCAMQGYLAAALGGLSLYRLAPYPRAFAESVPEEGSVVDP